MLQLNERPWQESEADGAFRAQYSELDPLLRKMIDAPSWRERMRYSDQLMALMRGMGHVPALAAASTDDLLSEVAFRWRQMTVLYDWSAIDLIPPKLAWFILAEMGLPKDILSAIEAHFTARVADEDSLARWKRASINTVTDR